MAAKKKKPAGSKKRRIEGAGWMFWSVSFIVLLGPSIYLAAQVKYSNLTNFGVVLYGFIASAVAASVLTLVVNSVFQFSIARIRKFEKRRAKKSK